MQFEAVIRTTGGKVTRLSVQSSSLELAKESLRSSGRVVSIVPQNHAIPWKSIAGLLSRTTTITTWFGTQLGGRKLAHLLGSISELLASKIPIAEALEELADSNTSKSVRRAILAVHARILDGSRISEALGTITSNETVLQLVQLGEKSGDQAKAFAQACEHLRSQSKIRNQVIGALAYPTIVAVASLAVALYLVTTALPELTSILAASGREVPAVTQSLLTASDCIKHSYRQILLVAFTAVAALFVASRQPSVVRLAHRTLLRIPVLRQIIRMRDTQRYAASLAALLSSGMPLQKAMQNSVSSIANLHLRSCVDGIARQVADGKPAGEAVDAQDCLAFPLPSLLRVGERTGHVREAAVKAAAALEQTLLDSLKHAIRVIEPVMIITVGSVVGYVYIAFILALMTASGGLR